MRFRGRDRVASRWDGIARPGRGLLSHPFFVRTGAENVFSLKVFSASFAYILQGILYH